MPFALPDDLNDVRFLSEDDVILIHASILEQGQLPGVKSHNGLAAAVGRVLNVAYFNPAADLAHLAAVYWHGISANHAFHDGNKRAGFFSMLAFLEANGLEFMGEDSVMGELIYCLFELDQFNVENLTAIVRDNTRPLVE